MNSTLSRLTLHRLASVNGMRSLLSGRRLPVLLLLAGALSFTPGLAHDAAATGGCYLIPGSLRISGGYARNVTVVNPEANGGVTVANAPGGDNNLTLGIFGDASAGNGGTASAAANGGAIALGDINSGGNTGNVIRVHSFIPIACGALTSWIQMHGGAPMVIHGGVSSNATSINPEANGGVAIANAAGGDDNLAVGILGSASAGNGGTANASANGGAITLGDVNSGGNVGNVIQSGGPGSGGSAALNGGVSSNSTSVNPEANGGLAAANAPGGDGNLAVGVLGDASAGNGGTADASANGGAIAMGDVNSGQNVGNVVQSDGLSGSTSAYGGYSGNETAVNPEASGGTAIGNAEGGDDNAAIGVLGDASAGNGGTADASANGGAIAMGDVNSGQNTGNVIDAGK